MISKKRNTGFCAGFRMLAILNITDIDLYIYNYFYVSRNKLFYFYKDLRFFNLKLKNYNDIIWKNIF